MPISELTRVCLCHAMIYDAAADACSECQRPLVPHHTTWPLYLKWWLLSELLRRRMYAWLTSQRVWEQLLRDAMVFSGAITAPNPRGAQFSDNTPAADLYPPALQLAQGWKAAGSPIAQAPDLARRSA